MGQTKRIKSGTNFIGSKNMNNSIELLVILLIVLAIAGPIGFIRYRLFMRFIQAQESIAESLKKLSEAPKK
jgi:hypothetical protein